MNTLVPNLLKPFIEIGIGIIYLFLFNVVYKSFIENIYTIMKENEASDYYSMIKMINYVVLVHFSYY